MKHAGIVISKKPVLVGVINLSPESFFKGSVSTSSTDIEQTIAEMVEYGVDCLDVGGMSTRPIELYGGERTTREIEMDRIRGHLPGLMEVANSYELPVALDTQFAEIAEFGIREGVKVINDISGLKTDPEMVTILADYDVDVVVMATVKLPGDVCGIDKTIIALEQSLELAASAGVARERIAIDPGFGGWQGRDKDCDLDLLRNFPRLKDFKLPIYVGVSRKSTIQTLGGGKSSEDRLVGSVITAQKLVDLGAHIIRTHDVKATRLGLNVFTALREY